MTKISLGEALGKATEYFQSKGCESPRLSAELLLAEVLSTDRIHLYMDFHRPLTPGETDAYRELIKRRGQGEPVAYILGRKEFYSLEFDVGQGILIPRPETEILVKTVLEILNSRGPEIVTLWDVGTGSGIIPTALATQKENLSLVASDVSEEALVWARRNAEKHGVSDRIEFFLADVDTPLGGEGDAEGFRKLLQGGFDAIVSNPPYIPAGELDGLQWEVRDWEPRLALDGGVDGLDVVRKLTDRAGGYLRGDGILLLEIGAGQMEKLKEEYADRWTVQSRMDLNGHERVAMLQRQ